MLKGGCVLLDKEKGEDAPPYQEPIALTLLTYVLQIYQYLIFYINVIVNI